MPSHERGTRELGYLFEQKSLGGGKLINKYIRKRNSVRSPGKKQLCKQVDSGDTRRNANKLAVNNIRKVSNVPKTVISYKEERQPGKKYYRMS